MTSNAYLDEPFVDEAKPQNDCFPIEECYVSLKGRKLCVRSCGDKGNPPIVLQHGIQSHAGVWDRIGRRLAQQGFYVVMPDRRGHGKSDGFDAYHLFDYVADLNAIVRERLNKPFLLLGHCESCMITALYAGAYPETLVAAAFLQFPIPPRQAVNDITKADLVRTFLNRTTQPQVHAVLGSVQEAVQRSIEASPFPMPEDVAMHVAQRNIRRVDGGFVWRWDPEILNYRLLYNTIDMGVVSTSLAGIKSPVMFIYGNDSSLIKLDGDRHWAVTHALRPDAQQILVPGGHYPHMQSSSEVLVSILTEAARA
jgi:pimeloyl-ACP methyl ester carboxylesterase